jgi:hypothetical protein
MHLYAVNAATSPEMVSDDDAADAPRDDLRRIAPGQKNLTGRPVISTCFSTTC